VAAGRAPIEDQRRNGDGPPADTEGELPGVPLATFVVLLIGVIVLVGALTFFPALLLGPVVQALTGHVY